MDDVVVSPRVSLPTSLSLWCVVATLLASGCSDSKAAPVDGGVLDAAPSDRGLGSADAITLADAAPDASMSDALSPDTGDVRDATSDAGASEDASAADAAAIDSGPGDAGLVGCGALPAPMGWRNLAPGYTAGVLATANLAEPSGLTFAGGAFGDALFVSSAGNDTIVAVDVSSGASTVFTSTTWAMTPGILTAIVWDRENVFDGALYVADRASGSDGAGVIHRVTPSGVGTRFAVGTTPGVDSPYALAFAPTGTAYPRGLYASGDTDGAGPDWGVLDGSGAGVAFSEVAGCTGIAFDTSGRFGGGMFASLATGGGYSGDGSIRRMTPQGTAGSTLAVGLGGVHALTFAPSGPFGGDAYAVRFDTQQLIRIAPSGAVTVLAEGLSTSSFDGNVLAFSPTTGALYLAERGRGRVVCVEAP